MLRALALLLLAGCGPQVGRWVVVTDCATKQPIAGAIVRVNEGVKSYASVGVPSKSPTNDKGQTYAKFPTQGQSWVSATATGYSDGARDVPAGATGAIDVCLNR